MATPTECFATPEEVEEGRQAPASPPASRPMYDRRHRDLSEERACSACEADGACVPDRCDSACRSIRSATIEPDLMQGAVVEVNARRSWTTGSWCVPTGCRPTTSPVSSTTLEMRITHVVRGDEHFMNGVKQSVLYRRARREAAPRFAHIPLILGKDGQEAQQARRAVDEPARLPRAQGFPAGCAVQLHRAAGLGVQRRPRPVHPRGDGRAVPDREDRHRRRALRRHQAARDLRPLHPRDGARRAGGAGAAVAGAGGRGPGRGVRQPPRPGGPGAGLLPGADRGAR